MTRNLFYMNLFLDDNRIAPNGWHTARTAEQAKLHLLHGDVDQMSIDHDLDAPACPNCNFQCGHYGGADKSSCSLGCSCHSAGDETGLDLVQWMADTGLWPKTKPTVHSHNLTGSLRMKKLINDTYPSR